MPNGIIKKKLAHISAMTTYLHGLVVSVPSVPTSQARGDWGEVGHYFDVNFEKS